MKNQKQNIIFDVDSTLTTIEGIDYLAGIKGVNSQVEFITTQTMNGKLNFAQALRDRLNYIRPSLIDLNNLAKAYIYHILPEAMPLIAHLQTLGHQVLLVSGGFSHAIYPLANLLDIPKQNVFTNSLLFNSNGNYLGFDQKNPLAQNQGKLKLIKSLLPQLHMPIFIGDSVADLEVKPVVSKFIGFGGVIERDVVKQQADHYIYNLKIETIEPLLSASS